MKKMLAVMLSGMMIPSGGIAVFAEETPADAVEETAEVAEEAADAADEADVDVEISEEALGDLLGSLLGEGAENFDLESLIGDLTKDIDLEGLVNDVTSDLGGLLGDLTKDIDFDKLVGDLKLDELFSSLTEGFDPKSFVGKLLENNGILTQFFDALAVQDNGVADIVNGLKAEDDSYDVDKVLELVDTVSALDDNNVSYDINGVTVTKEELETAVKDAITAMGADAVAEEASADDAA